MLTMISYVVSASVVIASFFTIGDASHANLYIIGAFGCHLDVYADGTALTGLPAKTVYPTLYKLSLPLPYTTVAIAMLPASKYAMFMARDEDLTLMTNGSWKCKQDTVSSNWMTPSFDDSTWKHPSTMALQLFDTKTANSMVFPILKVAACPNTVCNTPASWIASINMMSSMAKNMYCRFTISGNSSAMTAATSPPEDDESPAESPIGSIACLALPFYSRRLYSDVKLTASSIDVCYTGFRSKITCAQLCTTRYPRCVGFQYSQYHNECCLIDQQTMFLGDRLSAAGFSVWEIIGTCMNSIME